MYQKQKIALAEQAEAYIQYEARESANGSHNNKARMRQRQGARDFRERAKAGAL